MKDFKKFKRVLALCTVITIIVMVAVTFIAAICTKPGSNFFMGMITCMIILPIIAYGYMVLLKYIAEKKTSYDLNKEDEVSDNTEKTDIDN